MVCKTISYLYYFKDTCPVCGNIENPVVIGNIPYRNVAAFKNFLVFENNCNTKWLALKFELIIQYIRIY